MDLDTKLIQFSSDAQDTWTLRDAVRGTQIYGGIGSGKSSGSGKTIASRFLQKGFGGIVLCAKPDERDNWVKMAQQHGRSHDLIIFSEDSEYQFNPLHYELTRETEGGGEIYNLTNLFMQIYKMGNRFAGNGSSGESERYWDNALKRCLNRMMQLLQLADEEISIHNMQHLLMSAPLQHEIQELHEMNEEEQVVFAESSYCYGCLLVAADKMEEEQEDDFNLVRDYFMREYPNLPENTRPTIAESFLGIAEPFTSGILKKHFAGESNLNPEETFEGKIIILDFAVKKYLQAGVYAQGIYKMLWQQAAERRTVTSSSIPIFLWVDESQLFISDYDQIFQTTARSALACTVFISQNISNYYSAIGGKNPTAKIDSLLGNLGTKIFHANNDAVTNEWAARTIGKSFTDVKNFSTGQYSRVGVTQQLHWLVEPREFTTLRSGGGDNNRKVDSIITVAGRKWSTKQNFIRSTFNQN